MDRGQEIKQVLYADDRVLVAETRKHLQHTVNKIGRTCDRMGLKVNVGNSKLLVTKKRTRGEVVRR